MKKILFFLILNITIFTFGCTKALNVASSYSNLKGENVQSGKVKNPIINKPNFNNTIVSETNYDIDKDSKNERIQIILVNGNFIEDREPWSGSGQKWIGSFTINVLKNEAILYSQSLNKLMYPIADDAFFLYAPEFKLELNDYNNDGLIDFNIGEYLSSNGNEYKFFTISKYGTISELPFENMKSLFISSKQNSTNLKFNNGTVEIPYYDNSKGGNWVDVYKWDNDDKIFKLISHIKKQS